MWLAEGVNIPGYNAAIYRRYMTDTLGDESTLLAKSARLYPALGGKLTGLRWSFPAGSSIVMDGVAHEKSVLSVQGKEYHRMAFDEITHFTEFMYNFLYTTRMRKIAGFPILCGVRCSANPGGPGHEWVKAKWITQKAISDIKNLDPNEPTPPGTVYWKEGRAYVPSRAVDNPSLDIKDYLRRLAKNTNPVERARMMNGDWGVAPEGLIKANWLRYFTMRGRIIRLLVSKPQEDGSILHTDETLTEFFEGESRRFITLDTAGGGKDITAASKGKNPSYTAAGVWDYKQWGENSRALICREVWRGRVGFTEVAAKLLELNDRWNPSVIKVEDATMGPHLYDMLNRRIPIMTISTGSVDKVKRATKLLYMLERGEVYFPREENSWRPQLESEYLGWQGIDGEINDQIDMSSYAAIEAGGFIGGSVQLTDDPRVIMDPESSLMKGWI